MSGPVEHHANAVLPSFLPGSCPNPIKLISMNFFFFFTNGKPAVRDNPSAELCATGKHTASFFLVAKGAVCFCSLQQRKSQLCSLALLLLGESSREDLTITTMIKMILLVPYTETFADPLSLHAIFSCFLQIIFFFHTSFNLPLLQGFIQSGPTCRHNFLLQRIPQTPSTQHWCRSFLKILYSLPELSDFTPEKIIWLALSLPLAFGTWQGLTSVTQSSWHGSRNTNKAAVLVPPAITPRTACHQYHSTSQSHIQDFAGTKKHCWYLPWFSEKLVGN